LKTAPQNQKCTLEWLLVYSTECARYSRFRSGSGRLQRKSQANKHLVRGAAARRVARPADVPVMTAPVPLEARTLDSICLKLERPGISEGVAGRRLRCSPRTTYHMAGRVRWGAGLLTCVGFPIARDIVFLVRMNTRIVGPDVLCCSDQMPAHQSNSLGYIPNLMCGWAGEHASDSSRSQSLRVVRPLRRVIGQQQQSLERMRIDSIEYPKRVSQTTLHIA
jgi:hypothetical protein